MIQLTDTEKKCILLCKKHFTEEYPYTGSWAKTLIPLFEEIYGWDPLQDINSYLEIMFEKLLDTYLKIADDASGANLQIKAVFTAAFHKTISRTDDLSIERAIAELCALIQGTRVVDKYGNQRFHLSGEPPEELYYMQSGYVGDAMLWWRRGKTGYTTKVEAAHKFNRRDAISQVATRPGEDRAFPVSAVDDGLIRIAVRSQISNCEILDGQHEEVKNEIKKNHGKL